MKKQLMRVLVIGMLLLVMLAGCAPAAAPSISVESAWGKSSASMPTAGSLFMLIKNSGSAADKLVSGTSTACGSIELHEVVMKADGTMGMNLLDNPLDIPANGQLELKSGSYHIMCIMKNDDLFKNGAQIDLTLLFEKSGEKTVSAEIRAE